jgi:hypothetical protein
MLELKLRDEFLGTQMPGTAIELRSSNNQGAAQKSPDQILSITYPTADVQIALDALSIGRPGLPVVLVGDRGRGKSHIMAVMHHALAAPEIVQTWMKDWGNKLALPKLQQADIVKGYLPISEPVHNYEYHFLWDLLFERHPKGQYYHGQFENMPQEFPPRSLLEKMFAEQPTCLILDEFQTWYSGLPDTDAKNGVKIRQLAFNFIQVLSEIAKDRPDIFILVVSVLDTNNDAYQQIHRQGPVLINFHGATAKQDRRNLLLHRLFENRSNIQRGDVEKITLPYASERFRLLFPGKNEHDKDGIFREVADCWPFSPELIELLEDHILMSSAAQNTRDLIRILALGYKDRGAATPIITPADFFVDGNHAAAQGLVDAVAANDVQHRLIEVAQRNLDAVRNAGANVTHDREMVSAIWMYSLALGLAPGVDAPKLHLVVTSDRVIDDNTFQAELARLIENSVNIHGDETAGGLLRFELRENPRSKVKSHARNAKLWDASAVAAAGQPIYPGKDIEHIRKTLKAIFVPEAQAPTARVIVLGPNWKDAPWMEADDTDQPAKWDRPTLLVIPEKFNGDKAAISEILGAWLAKHVPKRRNTIRFLLAAVGVENLFIDKELIFHARCSYLCSKNAWGQDRTYSALSGEFDRPLRNALQNRFNRFGILRKWDFQQTKNCAFDIEKLNEQGGDIPKAVEQKIATDLFDQTEYQTLVLASAKNGEFVGSLLDELAEPPAPGAGDAIPYLGEIPLYERLLSFAAEGKIVLNVGGSWISRRPEDATTDDALRFFKSKAFRSQQENRQVQLGLPGVVGGTITSSSLNPVPHPNPQPATNTSSWPEGTPPIADPGTPAGPTVVAETPEPYAQPVRTKKTEGVASGINLSGCFETWGIDASQKIEQACLEFSDLTAQQIKQILQRIPSTFKATLEISYKEGGEQ